LYFLWAKNASIAPFLDSLSTLATQGKIAADGFDAKFTSQYGTRFFVSDLEAVVQAAFYKHSDSQEWEAYKKILQNIADKYDKVVKLSENQQILFKKVSEKLVVALDAANQKEWSHLIKVMTDMTLAYAQVSMMDMLAWNEKAEKMDSQRDKIMAENIEWLIANRYRGKKVIIWAASYHIIKSPQSVNTLSKHTFQNKTIAGNEIAKLHPGQTYHLGFVSYQGKYGISFDKPKGKNIDVAPDKSLEKYLHTYQYPFAFLVTRQTDWKDKTIASVNDFNVQQESQNWSENFDGIFYIRDMYPNVLK
jgi:erythromycin esterase-like protein